MKQANILRSVAVLLVLVMLWSATGICQVQAAGEPAAEFTAANPAAAYCISTDQMLYENRAGETFAPGVVTKLAALMVARDILISCNIPMNTEIEVDAAWVINRYIAGDRSSPYLGLSGGERYTLEYLFATSLVANANDSCAVLVNYCAGLMNSNEQAFLDRMNQKATDLGLTNTSFGDTVGFGNRGYTTATDAAKIVGAFYYYDDLVKLSDCITYGKIRNKNYLKCGLTLKGYVLEGAIGLIAGQASNQGNYCVLTAYEKDGIAYAFAVLGASGEKIEDNERWFDAGNAYEDIRAMIPHVTKAYGFLTVCKTEDILAEVRMGGGAEKDFLLLVPEKTIEMMVADPESAPIQSHITYDESRIYESEVNGKTWKTLDAPVRQGDVLGSVTYTQNGVVLATVALVAKDSVEPDTLKNTFAQLHDFLFNGPMGLIVKIILFTLLAWLVLALVAVIIRIVRWVKKRKE